MRSGQHSGSHSTQGGCLSRARAAGGKHDSGGTPPEAGATECDEMRRSAPRDATECDGLRHPNATESDEMRRNVTECDSLKKESEPQSYFARISTSKQAAIWHLLEGASVTETARRISTGRQTVSRWINHDFSFQMALDEKLRVIWGETTIGMAAHAREAIAKLAEMLASKHVPYRMRAARDILALTPLARQRSPIGPYLPFGP